MACCLVAALLFGSVRRLLDRLRPGRRPADLAFAPVATRPAPGAPSRVTPQAPSRPPAPTGPPSLRPVLAGLALGVAVYAIGVDLLATLGAVHTGAFLPRAAALGVVVAALALWAAACPPARDRGAVAVVVAAAGAAWTGVGTFEMHALGSLELASHTLVPDLAFHGSGLLVAALALTLLPRAGRTSDRAPECTPPTSAPSEADVPTAREVSA